MASQQTNTAQHCAHVADYYAARAEIMGSGIGRALRLKAFPLPKRPDHHYGGARETIQDAEYHLELVKEAAREWVSAGGAA